MKSHRVWLLGDDIDTDVLAPGAFMKGSIEELSKHCLEAVEPDFLCRECENRRCHCRGTKFWRGLI